MIRIKCDMKRIAILHADYVNEVLVPRFFQRYNNKNILLKKYLNSLLGDDKREITDQLKKLCVNENLDELVRQEQEIRDAVNCWARDISKEKLSLFDIKNFWDEVLNYSGFGQGVKKGKYSITWNRHLFVKMTNVSVCPYCNRNYITSYVEENKDDIKTTASLDHYYPKATYPFLQMNIYNMVPSCIVCNSYTKSSRVFHHLNPYFDDGSISFEIDSTSLNSLFPYMKCKSRVRVVSEKDLKSKQSIEAFKLSEIYESHNIVVDELYQKVMDYENFAEDYYLRLLGNIDIGIDNVYKNWFDFLDQEETEEPLVKMKKDIFNQIMGYKEK